MLPIVVINQASKQATHWMAARQGQQLHCNCLPCAAPAVHGIRQQQGSQCSASRCQHCNQSAIAAMPVQAHAVLQADHHML